jgi:hypothetical protein
MAQTNFTPILLYSSSTAAAVPLAANLINSATGSEIAINIADKNLFFKDSGGVVNTVPIRQSSTSSNGWLSNTDWNTFNNKSNTNGTVTSVAATVPAFLSISGSPITTSGTLAITLSGTALPTANGGTGLTSPGASGAFLISNGTSWYANVAPACRAYTTGNTSCAVNTVTKIILNAETFDTNNNFDSTTNYRFTPTVAGYYLLTGALTFFSYTATYTNLFFQKNGTATGPVGSGYSAGSGGVSFTTSDVVYLNGSTDYIEMFVVQGTGTLDANNGFFSAAMVRGA